METGQDALKIRGITIYGLNNLVKKGLMFQW